VPLNLLFNKGFL